MRDAPLPFYVRLIGQELKRRKGKNPRYSLRAFAGFLGLDPGALSRILSGKQELTGKTCAAILGKLELTPEDQRHFIASVAEDKYARATALMASALGASEIPVADLMSRERLVDLARGEVVLPHSILSFSPDAIGILDRDRCFLFANVAFAKMAGRVPCEIVGVPPSELALTDSLAEAVELQMASVLESGQEESRDVEISAQSGMRWLESVMKPVRIENGDVRAVLWILRDVTTSRRRDIATRFLWDATRVLGSSLEYDTTLDQVARLAVPSIADYCLIDVDRGGDALQRVAVASRDDIRGDVDHAPVAGRHSAVTDADGPGAVTRTGVPELHPSSMIVPLRAQGHVLGAISLSSSASGRYYDALDLDTATQLADRAAIAISNAQRCSEWRARAAAPAH